MDRRYRRRRCVVGLRKRLPLEHLRNANDRSGNHDGNCNSFDQHIVLRRRRLSDDLPQRNGSGFDCVGKFVASQSLVHSAAGDDFWHKEMPAKFPHLVLRDDHRITRVPFGHSLAYGRARWTWRAGQWYEWVKGAWRAGRPPSRLQHGMP